MADYLVKNVDEFRTVTVGRLRWSPGRQMWISDELFSHRKVQSLVEGGVFSVLQSRGVVTEEPLEEPAVEEAEEAPSPLPEATEEPLDERPVEAEEEVFDFSESQLKSKKVAELRDLADSMSVSWAGLRKAELISALLSVGAEE